MGARRTTRRRRALPRSAKPAAKFVKVHCVAGHGRMDASVIPRTAERVPWNYRCFVPNGFRSEIEGRAVSVARPTDNLGQLARSSNLRGNFGYNASEKKRLIETV